VDTSPRVNQRHRRLYRRVSRTEPAPGLPSNAPGPKSASSVKLMVCGGQRNIPDDNLCIPCILASVECKTHLGFATTDGISNICLAIQTVFGLSFRRRHLTIRAGIHRSVLSARNLSRIRCSRPEYTPSPCFLPIFNLTSRSLTWDISLHTQNPHIVPSALSLISNLRVLVVGTDVDRHLPEAYQKDNASLASAWHTCCPNLLWVRFPDGSRVQCDTFLE
jgi:hypothetical protein